MRQYLSPAEFALTPVGSVLAGQFPTPGLLDRALARASDAADHICKHRLGLNGATTLSQAAGGGATVLHVADTTGLDAGAQGWVAVDDGQNQVETVRVLSVQPTWPTSGAGGPPYVGTLTLANPLVNGHSSGAVVQGVTVERVRMRGGSTNAFDFGGPITQESQLAEAHAPKDIMDDLVRVIRLAGRPLVSVISLQVAHRWSGSLITLSTTNLAINAAEGWIRLNLGTFVEQGADIVATYTAGYGAPLPDDIQEAVALLTADALAKADPIQARGIIESSLGGRKQTTRLRMSAGGAGRANPMAKSVLYLEAEARLAEYVSRTF